VTRAARQRHMPRPPPEVLAAHVVACRSLWRAWWRDDGMTLDPEETGDHVPIARSKAGAWHTDRLTKNSLCC
jgi:hypothetical protein